MTSVERIFSEAMKLGAEERAELSERLLVALPDEMDPAVEEAGEAWMKETFRRRAEWKAGRVKAVPWEEARKRIFAEP